MVCKTTLQAALFAAMMLAIVSGGMAQEATPAKVNPEPRRSNVFDVRDYGAVADGKTLDTRAISKAIYAAAAAGGGRVVFSPGVYSTGTFELLSNVILDVEAGAVIQGSKDVADYGSIAEYGFGRVYGLNSSGEAKRSASSSRATLKTSRLSDKAQSMAAAMSFSTSRSRITAWISMPVTHGRDRSS